MSAPLPNPAVRRLPLRTAELAIEPLPTRFSLAEAQQAADAWGANCGPGALAAVLGMTLAEVRPHMGDFERKGYTNPTLMFDALRSIGARWKAGSLGQKTAGATCTFLGFPTYGLARIQWEGPWTKPGVPIRVRYRHTHWVGACHRVLGRDVGVFDINCMNNGTGWVSLEDWRAILVPWLLEQCVPRADGLWHITHAIEIERP